MPEDSLIFQLANRAKTFYQNTNISQCLMARAIGMTEANYSQFLNKKRGLSEESTCLLLKFTNMPKREAIATFSAPVRNSKILCLQERGRARMSLDGSGVAWVPGLSGLDPNGTTGIDDTPEADVLPEHDHYLDQTLDTLRSLKKIYRAGIGVINDFIQNAKVNQGSTPPTAQKFSRRK
jgi:transcriptional regulator with XRE-family HTH domain